MRQAVKWMEPRGATRTIVHYKYIFPMIIPHNYKSYKNLGKFKNPIRETV